MPVFELTHISIIAESQTKNENDPYLFPDITPRCHTIRSRNPRYHFLGSYLFSLQFRILNSGRLDDRRNGAASGNGSTNDACFDEKLYVALISSGLAPTESDTVTPCPIPPG